MTVSALGQFASGFTSWNKVLASVPAEARTVVFANACADVAEFVRKGLDKLVAVDALTDMATAHGLDDRDVVQEIIAEAFRNTVTDTVVKPNGHGRAAVVRSLMLNVFTGGFMPPDYLIEGILQRRFVYALTGPTSHAKTAIALLLAQLVACENEHVWLGTHRVAKGRVMYFVGENPDDVRMRLIGAASLRSDNPERDRMFFIPGVLNLAQLRQQLHDEFARIGGIDLVVVDTSAAYFLGLDENANAQMGQHARMLRMLTELPGQPCVLVLCHPSKHACEPDNLQPRGGGAFIAEMDGNLTCWKVDDLVTLHHTKMRGPGFEPIVFKLETIRTPTLVDKQGRELPTVRAVPISRSEEDRAENRTRDEEDRVLAAKLKEPDATVATLAEICGWLNDGQPAKSRVHRVLQRLVHTKPQLVRQDRGKYLLTDDGKRAARDAGTRFARQEAAEDSQSTMQWH